MKQRSCSKKVKSSRRGSALAVVMVFVLVFAIAIASIVGFTSHQTRTTYRTRSYTQSLEGAHATLQQITNNVMHIASTTASTTVRPPTQLGGELTMLDTIINQIEPIAFQGSRFVEDKGKPLAYIRNRGENNFNFTERTDPDDPWRGYSTARFEYEIVSFIQEDSNRSNILGVRGAGVKSRITIDYIPLYQFAIFYNGDLELHPGPIMDVKGRVHSNSNLYFSSGNRLDFHERVSAAGRFLRFRAENQTGDVRINNGASGNNPNFVSMKEGNGWLENGVQDWLGKSVSRWNNYVRDTDHGVTLVLPPLPNGVRDPREMIRRVRETDTTEVRQIRFEYLADVIVSGDPGNPATIKAYRYNKDENGNITGRVEYTNVQSFVSVGEFYDGQQLTIVKTLDIMMDELLKHPVSQDLATGLGMLYVSTTPGMLDQYNLPAGSLDPIYKRDAQGKLIFDTFGRPTTVPVSEGGREGWLRAAVKQTASNTITFTEPNYMPAVRITNKAKHNATYQQRLAGPVRFPRNTSNGFGFYTDRPLYVAGDRVNTVDKTMLVLGADSITVTAYEQALATKDRGVISSNATSVSGQPNGIYESTANNVTIMNGHTRDMGNIWQNAPSTPNFTNQTVYSWERNNSTDRRHNASQAMASSINAIFLMGNSPSVGNPGQSGGTSHQSGGAHNVIRYNENWDGITHTINGSIICLFDSAIAVQHNRAGFRAFMNRSYRDQETYYTPPNRNYQWDGSLRTTTPPPGMPIVIEVNRSAVERVSYDYAQSNRPK